MIDVRRLRTELDAVREALVSKRVDPADIDRAADLDARHRAMASKRDELRGQRNALSKEVGAAFKAGDRETGERLRAESLALESAEAEAEVGAATLADELRELLLRIPNIPHPDAPIGADERDNPILRTGGPDPGSYAEHQRVPHWESAVEMGILDLERAVKISGSMFTMLRGAGASLDRALCQYALDRNADAFEEIRPPTLVTSDTLTATGHLPKFADDAYHIERDDLWAIPTAEVPLTSLAGDEVFDADDLPLRLMAYTPCYRREAGSAGRDTRGLLRVHEFDKVEMYAFTTPEQAPEVLDDLIERSVTAIGGLGLSWRLIEICTGDQGQSHHRSFDVEVWAPGAQQWLEVASVSWVSDYQARRANIRYRPADGGGTAFVHTLNGSALAVPRVWAAIVESNRQPDGSIAIPEVLWGYMRGETTITAKG